MGERKVINKYYPPDFDPALIPRGRKRKSNQIKVRMMLPMSIQCSTCGEYLYKGKKFNSRKETVQGEEYLGLKVFRFYIRCTRCSSEMTIKTDPKNSDYTAEFGCVRNYEPWRNNNLLQAELERRQVLEEEPEQDAMEMLETKTLETRRQLQALDTLDELKSISARNAEVTTEELLELYKKKEKEQEKENEEDEEEIRKLFGVKRIEEESSHKPEEKKLPKQEQSSSKIGTENSQNTSHTLGKLKKDSLLGLGSDLVVIKKKSKKKNILEQVASNAAKKLKKKLVDY